MDDPKIDDKVRHTVSFTHRQLGVGGGIVAAIMVLSPVKEWFFTREEGRAQGTQIEQTKAALAELREDIGHRMERNTDKIIDRIKEAEERSVKSADRQERRIDGLEVAWRMKSSKITN